MNSSKVQLQKCKINKEIQCPLFGKLQKTQELQVEEKNDQKNCIKRVFGNTKGNFGNVAVCMKVENEIMIRMRGGGGLLYLSGASSPLKLQTINPR